MASPTAAISRFDLSMTYAEFALAANRAGFIGLSVLPPIGVQKENGDFAKLLVENVFGKPEDTERAPRAEYKRDTFQWTSDSYDCKEHGVEEVVDDSLIERYGDILRAESIAASRAIDRVLKALEADIAAAVFDTSTWTGSDLTTGVSTAWTTNATADPVSDVLGAIEKVEDSCGMTPNTIILTHKAIREFKKCTKIKDQLKYSGIDDPKNLGALGIFKALFDVENVFVAKGFQNTADEGQSASFGRCWDDTKLMVCHVNNDGMNGDLEAAVPNIGRTIFPVTGNAALPGADDGESSLIIEEYREEKRRGGIIRARNKRHVKILHAEAGHLLTNVTA
jgi:hypothetical protein